MELTGFPSRFWKKAYKTLHYVPGLEVRQVATDKMPMKLWEENQSWNRECRKLESQELGTFSDRQAAESSPESVHVGIHPQIP